MGIKKVGQSAPITPKAQAGSAKKASLETLSKKVTECIKNRSDVLGVGKPPVISQQPPRSAKRADHVAKAALPATNRKR